MSVYKEAMYTVRKIKQRSTQIFNDAADYGIPIKSMSDPIFKEIEMLKRFYWDDRCCKREVVDFNIGKTVTLKMQMIDEFGNGDQFTLTIEFTKQSFKTTIHGQIIGILTVDDQNKW